MDWSETSWRVERPHLDQVTADRPVGAAVLIGIADPERAAVLEADEARALDLQEELLDRVRDPEKLEATAIQGTAFDLAPRMVGLEPVAIDPAAHPAPLQILGETAELDRTMSPGAWRSGTDQPLGSSEPSSSGS